MDKHELLRLIDQAAREGWTSLDLSNQGLTELPPEIGEVIGLTELYLSNNQLTALPYEFRKLINLKTLFLGGNQFQEIPSVVLYLVNIDDLDLEYNELTMLPPEIGNLKSLTRLNLKHNKLTTLPIEIANLKNLKRFDLSANVLSTFPLDRIGELKNLERLDLKSNLFIVPLLELKKYLPRLIWLEYSDENETTCDLSNKALTEIPYEVWQQSNLKRLDLSHNQLTYLPREIENLTNLQELDLSYNQISKLPSEIGKLLNLTALSLVNNHLSEIPSLIGKLTKLRILSIRNNRIIELPPEIGKLINLERLSAPGNKLVSLPQEIENLSKIKWLNLRNNELSMLREQIGNLKNLIEFDLRNNQLTSLPPEITKLNNLRKLQLQGNNLLRIPPEILELRNEPIKILNYYFQQGQKKPLHEVKVLIVGQGAVGKTSLIKRLLDDSFNPHETKTDGIAINQWHLSVNGADIRLNLWDFGGQEIMHATHQFFLTKRSLYVLVLDSRLDEQNNRVEYWLKTIQSFGGDSPIIVVCNKCDEHSLDLNWKGLQEKYPTIKAFAKRLSCKTGEGLMELHSLIAQEVGQLPHLNDELLLTWFAVKTKLEEMEANYIGYNEYQQMCETEQVTDELSQQTLLGFLHDLGIVLHFHDHPILEDTNVLNPEWVTRGIYQIVNSNELFQRKGELERSALAHILPAAEYPRSKHQFILDMMRKFELCFDFAESAGERFLVPDLLSREEPYTGEWGDSLAFQYHYDILPGSVISRFMVRMHAYIHQKTYWRNGVVLLSDDSQNRALIKADIEDRKIFIHVSGRPETRSLFLAIIRADFRKIHATIPKLSLKEVIPLPGHPDVTIDYADLLKLRERGITTYYYPKADTEINVNQLLDGLDPAKPKGNGATLPFAIQQQMIAFLMRLPNLHDPAGQRALVYSAGLDKSIQDQLQFGLPVAQFVPMLVTILSNHERLADGRIALVALLETARQSVGKDTRDECDRLLNAVF